MERKLTAPQPLSKATLLTNINPILMGSDACHKQLELHQSREFLGPDEKEQQLPKDLPISWMVLLEELTYVLWHGVHVHPLHCMAIVQVVGLQFHPITAHLPNNLSSRNWASVLANLTSDDMSLIFPVFGDDCPTLKGLWKRLPNDGSSNGVVAGHIEESREGIFVLLGGHVVVEVLENWSFRMIETTLFLYSFDPQNSSHLCSLPYSFGN